MARGDLWLGSWFRCWSCFWLHHTFCSCSSISTYLTSSMNVKEILALSSTNCIIGFSIIIHIPILFHPLQKFKVILVFCFAEFININVLLHVILGKTLLEYFKVFHILIVVLSIPFDLTKSNCSGIY